MANDKVVGMRIWQVELCNDAHTTSVLVVTEDNDASVAISKALSVYENMKYKVTGMRTIGTIDA